MTVSHDLESAREELEALVLDVLGSVLGEEGYLSWDMQPTTPAVASQLVIHDEVDDSYLTVDVRMGHSLARLLAARMMGVEEPSGEDVLDAVGEMGNIIGGNVKSLFGQSARLSLPAAEVVESLPATAPDSVTVTAAIHDEAMEMVVTPGASDDALYWPPTSLSEVLEGQP